MFAPDTIMNEEIVFSPDRATGDASGIPQG